MFKGIREVCEQHSFGKNIALKCLMFQILSLLGSGRVTRQEIFDASLARMREIRNLNAFISQCQEKQLLPVSAR